MVSTKWTAPCGAGVLALLVGCSGGGGGHMGFGLSTAPVTKRPVAPVTSRSTPSRTGGIAVAPHVGSVVTSSRGSTAAAPSTASIGSATIRATLSPSAPAVNAPFTVTIDLLDASGQPMKAPQDLAVAIVAPADAGLEPSRGVTGKLPKGSATTSLGDLRAANTGQFGLQVSAGTLATAIVLQVGDVTFTNTPSAETRVDAGGAGYRGVDLAARDDQAAIVFTDARLGKHHVFIQATLDAGKTWNGVVRVDHGADDCRDPAVAVDGAGLVAVAWTAADGVFANVSTDGGATFFPKDVRLDSGAGAAKKCQHIRAATDKGRVLVAWSDDRNLVLGDQVFLARSLDRGVTWQAEERVDQNAPMLDKWVVRGVSLVATGDAVNVLWNENGELLEASSLDGAATFAAPQKLNQGKPAHMGGARLASSGGILHAAWYDDHLKAKHPRIVTRRSMDGGQTWDAEYYLPEGSHDLHLPIAVSLAASGSNVVVCYTGRSTGSAKHDRVFVARSTDGGETFNLDPGAVPQALTGADAENARAAACGKHLVVTWNETYAHGQRANASDDGGQTFRTADDRVDGSKTVHGTYTGDRVVAAGGAVTYIVWGEERGTSRQPHLYVVSIR